MIYTTEDKARDVWVFRDGCHAHETMLAINVAAYRAGVHPETTVIDYARVALFRAFANYMLFRGAK